MGRKYHTFVGEFSSRKNLDYTTIVAYNSTRCAEVVELVDALDSGSSELSARVGSNPTFGTIFVEKT